MVNIDARKTQKLEDRCCTTVLQSCKRWTPFTGFAAFSIGRGL